MACRSSCSRLWGTRSGVAISGTLLAVARLTEQVELHYLLSSDSSELFLGARASGMYGRAPVVVRASLVAESEQLETVLVTDLI